MPCEITRTLPFEVGSYPVTCSDCGASDLTEYFTSHALGVQLCQVCFYSRVERGLAKEG